MNKIEKYPENYIAYIGIGQVTNQIESEKFVEIIREIALKNTQDLSSDEEK